MAGEETRRVSPLKKEEGTEYQRVTITLEPDLFKAVKGRCKDERVPLSTLIGDLLSAWMKGETHTPEDSFNHTDMNRCTQMGEGRVIDLEERVKALSGKIESLMHTDTKQYDQIIASLTRRIDDLIPRIEHLKDESTHTLTRLSALEQDRATDREVVSSVITGDSPIPGEVILGDDSDKPKGTRPRKKASSEISDRDMALIELMATIPRTKLKEMGCRGYGDLAKYRTGEKAFKDVTYQHNINALKQNGYMIETPSPEGT